MHLILKKTKEENLHFIEQQTDSVLYKMSEEDKQNLCDTFGEMKYYTFKKNGIAISCFSKLTQEQARKILDKNVTVIQKENNKIGYVIDQNIYLFNTDIAIKYYCFFEDQKFGEAFITQRRIDFKRICEESDKLIK